MPAIALPGPEGGVLADLGLLVLVINVGLFVVLTYRLWRARPLRYRHGSNASPQVHSSQPTQPITTSESSISRSPASPLLRSGFVACATRANAPGEENQDTVIATKADRYQLIAVADGVHMTINAQVASRTVIGAFQNYVDETEPLDREATSDFYPYAMGRIGTELGVQNKPLNSAATTFIGVVETTGHFIMTHLGDGAVYQIVQSHDGRNIAATSVLLTSASPDVPPQLGAKYMSAKPEVHEIAKQQPEGYMWLIATDGMNDLERYIAVGDIHHRITGAAAAEQLATEIWQAFRGSPETFSAASIEPILVQWIRRCQSTDDATIAVLISGEMRAHWDRLVLDDAVDQLQSKI